MASIYDRKPYLEQVQAEHTAHLLGEQVGYAVLCGFCRYFNGYDEDVRCEHPLNHSQTGPDYRNPIPDEMAMEGEDCWGFKPKKGAKCDPHRRIYHDSQYPHYLHRQAPGKRIAELIELGPEKCDELKQQHWAEQDAKRRAAKGVVVE